jgi:DNA replication protein DnaC
MMAMRRLSDILAGDPRLSSITSSSAEPLPPPNCPLCNDAGFVRRQVPVGDPEFGRAFPCRCAREESAEIRDQRLLRYSNLGPLAGHTIGSLDPGRSPGFQDALRAARALASKQSDKPWMLIVGPAGVGKTSLGAAIANDSIAAGRATLYVVAPDLLDHLRAAYRKDASVPYPSLFEQVRNAPLLIIDDLDATNPTDWAGEKIFQIANYRTSARLSTILLSAFEPSGPIRNALSVLDKPDLIDVFHLQLPGAGGATPDASGTYREIGGMARDQLQRYSFDAFRLHGRLNEKETQNLDLVRSMVQRWAADPVGWLALLGPTGTGKTHLAAAVAHERLAAGESVFFAVVPDLLDHLRRAYRPDNPETYDDVFDDLRNAGLLVLDDLGAHSTTPWAEEKLYQLLSYRYLQSAPTVITTNVKPEDLDPRLASRIFDHQLSQIYELDARDYRTGASPRAVQPRRRASAWDKPRW